MSLEFSMKVTGKEYREGCVINTNVLGMRRQMDVSPGP